MSTVTPIKRPAPIGNLKPISDPRFSAEAMVDAVRSVAEPSAFGQMSTPRRAILECLVRYHPAVPNRKELRLCSGLNEAALSEHLQALRWKGWLMFESLSFAPITEARLIAEGVLEAPVKTEFRARIGKVRPKQPKQDTPADTTTHPQGSQGEGGFFPTFPAPAPLAHPIGATPAPSAADHHAQDGETQQLCDPCTDAALGNLSTDRERVTTEEPIAPAARPKRARVAKPEPAKERKFSAGSGEPACSPSLPDQCEVACHEAVASKSRNSKEDRTPPEGDRVSRGSTATSETPESAPVRTNPDVAEAAVERVAPVSQPATQPKIRDWMTERRERLNAAIVFLKSQAVLVTQWDRGAQIPRYQVSGKRELKFAEEVIEIAIGMGWRE